jgi:hypothetical protein
MALLLLATVAWAESTSAPPARTIRVLTVGSSSFGPELMINAQRIAAASANVRIECEGGAGYTRLDAFLREPGFYEEWCTENLPMIEAKRFDFVVFQTIGWVTMTPEEQDKLLTVIFPDLVAKIRTIGPDVALYDKFVRGTRQEKDPRARKWDGRYPDAQRLNCLLHILVAKKAGISKITFSGEAIVAGWETEPFKRMKYLYNDVGHPGVIGHYINGFCAAAMLTGIEPVGCPVRKLPIPGWIPKTFNDEPAKGGQDFYDKWKDRIDGKTFTLSDEEAKLAQEIAMKHRQYWSGRLQAALKDTAAFARVEAEIAELRAGFDKPELVGMSAKGIEALKMIAKAQAGESSEGISEQQIKNFRDQSRGLKDFGKLVNKHLKAPDDKAVLTACRNFWTENNCKLRDDVLFEAMVHAERVKVAGNREDVARMKQVVLAINGILNMGGYRMIHEKLPESEKAAFLAREDGPGKRFAPNLAAALKASANDPARYFKVCEAYLKVWQDVNLMDKLKEKKFAQEVFLEADQEFAKSKP